MSPWYVCINPSIVYTYLVTNFGVDEELGEVVW
jgi:hypothetical protein